ncbi:ImmA/IrrE family metallo-endopeptidase [Nocardia goodfellowii]|uniref:Transcriptional regulator n=1 Tax=Nocardia goodfellowii TaxID=882446 RepID=A0ABS4QBF3_9NOCA|nr:ImmA/IrrE family metallo-endopeptidase [Nocardia goodfellowii]MBP2188465.1 putative transcriptional regulator [Nocardia goodfellowii]
MPGRRASTRYDARTHAAKLDITIADLAFDSEIVIWDPEHRAIMITAELSAVDRREGLAHAMAHAQLEHTETVRKARMGRESRLITELRVYETACRNLIPIEELKVALARYRGIEEAAEWLQVNPDTVRYRLRSLSRSERRDLPADNVNRLNWSEVGDDPIPISCIWTNAEPVPVHRKLTDALRTAIPNIIAYR